MQIIYGILTGSSLWDALIALRGGFRRAFHRVESRREDVARVLIVELTRLGDVLTMIPAIQPLRRNFQGAEFHVIVDHLYVGLLESMDLGITVHGIEHSTSLVGFIGAIRIARSLRADLAISMSPAKRNAIVCTLGGAKGSVGYLTFVSAYSHYAHPVPIRALGYRLHSAQSFGREHIGERSIKITEALGCEKSSTTFERQFPGAHSDILNRAVFERTGLPRNRYVVIHPFSGWSYRTWAIGRFQALSEYITTSMGFEVVLLCGEGEKEALEMSGKRLGANKAIHFFPSSDLRDSAAIIRQSSLFIGNDSGPLHLAAHMGIPCVGLFGPAAPELTAPVSDRNIYLFHRVDCSPCTQMTCTRPTTPCIDLITTEEVIAAVTTLLKGPSHGIAVKNG